MAFETAVAGETCSWTELGGTRGWNSCEQVRFCAVHDSTTVIWSSETMVALELHMDDSRRSDSAWTRKISQRSGTENNFNGGKPYEHLKRLRLPMTGETRIQPKPEHLEFVADQLGLTSAKTRPIPGVQSHRATMDATPLLTADDARLYRSCVGALMDCVLDRADAQLGVSSLETYLRAPTSGAMEALRSLTRYLLGTQTAYVKLRIQSDDLITVELVGYSDSDWVGDPSSRKSQSSGHVEANGCPLTSFSRRQSSAATSSGMADYHAMCSTAEALLHLRAILEHFGFRVNTTLYCDSVAPRGIAQRAGLGKVKALAVKTLWLQEVVCERRPQIKSMASKVNKADLGTEVLPMARLKHTVESENELDPD